MNNNLWEDSRTGSDSTTATASTTADAGDDESPLAAAIEASQWSREDVELALHAAQVLLLAVWVFLIYQNDD